MKTIKEAAVGADCLFSKKKEMRMARNKFRPTRKWVETSIKAIAGPNGTSVVRVPAGEKPDGVVIASMPSNSIRRGVVELQGGIYHGMVVGPIAYKKHRVRNWQRAFIGTVAKHGGRELVFTEERMPDGEAYAVARLKANMQQANALVGTWQGDIRFPGLPS